MKWIALLFIALTGCAAGYGYRCRRIMTPGAEIVECHHGRWDYVRCTRIVEPDGSLFEQCTDSQGNIWECRTWYPGPGERPLRQCWAR